MKIAVAADNETTIAHHLGRCESFLRYDIDQKQVKDRQVVPNQFRHHSHGQCKGHETGPHSHAGLIEAIGDCQVVICGGVGRRAIDDLASHGIEVLVINQTTVPDEAVRLYLEGKIEVLRGLGCSHISE